MSAERPETAHPESPGNDNGEAVTTSSPPPAAPGGPPVPSNPGSPSPDATVRPAHFASSDVATAESESHPAAHLPAAAGRGLGDPDAGLPDPTRPAGVPRPPATAPPFNGPSRFGGLEETAARRPAGPRGVGARLFGGRLPTRPRLRGPRPPQEGGRPTEGRWVDCRLRHVHPLSVLKMAGLFYVCLFLTLMVAAFLLWNVGRSTETIDQLEGFITRLGAYGRCVPEDSLEPGSDFERDEDCPDGRVLVDGFRLDDGTIFRTALFGGIVLVVAGTAGTVLLTLLFNLLTEVTGGVRYTTIRETLRDPPRVPGRSPDPKLRR